MGHYVTIEYTDGTKEQTCVDECGVKDGCLYLYTRFGVRAGTRNIPLERVKEWIKEG